MFGQNYNFVIFIIIGRYRNNNLWNLIIFVKYASCILDLAFASKINKS